MKQTLRQRQRLTLNVTTTLADQIQLLSLSGFEVSTKLNELINEYFDEEDKKVAYFRDEYLLDRYKNILDQGNNSNILSQEIESDLQKKLLEQLEISHLDNMQVLVGQFLIDSIEGSGRLDPELEFEDIKKIVLEDFGETISDEYIEYVLSHIQNFDPPGCAYRNINESLSIQIDNLEIAINQKEILKEHLNDLVQNNVLIHQLPEDVRKNLKRLSLNPAGSYGQESQNYVRPDVLAIKNQNSWYVSLNDDFMSKELLNSVKHRINSSDNEKNYNSKIFIKGLERRQQTLLVVSEFLVEAQKNFLDAKSTKRAISNKEIAEKLNISQSTVSRIVRNKYLQLPDKLIPLNDLLERRINKHKDGKDVTADDLKFLLKKLIEDEDKLNPYSDEFIKIELKNKFKISISRRTIAKYRLELKIPSSKKRQLKN